jgi:condensin complex subunit 2
MARVRADYLQDEMAWEKCSNSLNAGSRIYSYRVDYLHGNTFKVAGGVTRTDKKLEEAAKPMPKKEVESVTIERSSNITLDRMDMRFEIDPVFSHYQARFDSSKDMLLASVSTGPGLQLLFGRQSLAEKAPAPRPLALRLGEQFEPG